MEEEYEGDIEDQSADNGTNVADDSTAFVNAVRRSAALDRNTVDNGISEERAKQDHGSQIAVREKVGEGPQFDRGEHGMSYDTFDVRGYVCGDEQNHREDHQQKRDVGRPYRRHPDLRVFASVDLELAVADDDQDETN